MSPELFLNGKFSRLPLPVVQDPRSVPPEALKRLALSQGELAQVHNGAPGIQYLAYVELVSGTTRGNHYHQRKQESFYLISGEMELGLEDIATGEQARVLCRAGDLMRIETGVAHVLRITRSGQGFEFSPQPFDSADVYRHPVMPG